MNKIESKLDLCEQQIRYRFKDRSLLLRALSHSSYAPTDIESYERLEFLGDSVLGLAIAHLLYERYPRAMEGELTHTRSSLVSQKSCVRVARRLKLDQLLFCDSSIRTPPDSMVADIIESIIGAVYLDAGYKRAVKFVHRVFVPELDFLDENETIDDYKSHLQDHIQRKKGGKTVRYILLDEKGPPHCRCFKIAVQIGGNFYQAAWGMNKKETQQRAAENALAEIQGGEPPHTAGD